MNIIGIIIFLLGLSTITLWHIEHKPTTIVVHLCLLTFTPWFLILLLGRPSLVPTLKNQPWMNQLSANLSYFTSNEFLFFSGDSRPGYGTSDHGVFLLSFMPLLLAGTYSLLLKRETKYKVPLWWVLVGLTVAILFGSVSGLPAALWYLPGLSIIATQGATTLITAWKDRHKSLKMLIALNGIWLAYESMRLYHVILVHKPFEL